jgi:carbon monoxide dehydrogenase subunit G
MQFTGSYAVPAPRAQVWDALNDPALLQVCIDGCEKLAWTGEGTLETVVAAKVGPISARFKGSLWLSDVVPGTSYVLNGQGEGKGAGFVKARAEVSLEDAADGGCRLSYKCETNLGGILATVGNKLMQGMADRTADQFFERFIQRLVVAMAAAKSLSETPPSDDVEALQSEGQEAATLIASIDSLLNDSPTEPASPVAPTTQTKASSSPDLPRPIVPLTDPSLLIIGGGFGIFAIIILLLTALG